jgi:diketogulonate reductase-like aldo/keto reductase
VVQKELMEYCGKHGIQVVAYSSLGSGELITFEPVIRAAAGADVVNLLLRWSLQQVCLPS